MVTKNNSPDRMFIDITEGNPANKMLVNLNRQLQQSLIERTSQLESANKNLDAFAYSVSHDLRAPLRAVDGFSRFLMEDYQDRLDSECLRLLNLIRSNVQKMDQLIVELLALSKIIRCELNLSRIDMTQMAISMFNEKAAPDVVDRIEFTVDPLPEAIADPTYLKLVWANLISNAIKFSSKGKKPSIRIYGQSESGFNDYHVKDNGAGFNPEYTHKLFGVFQRLHKSDDFEGTGMGLAIVQRIIHRHGGKVWTEGAEGKGATFSFSLPVRKIDREPHC
ncbi:MAG: GHKL domain-containing protein [Bacteroidales bacterium]|nr:GHKL domain-containing protein [Bacteroidales bacterium]